MLITPLIQSNYPNLLLSDKVMYALQLMEDDDIQHLPVLLNDQFLGLVSKHTLLDANEGDTVSSLQEQFVKGCVNKDSFLLLAVKVMAEHKLSLIAVTTETNEFLGVITAQILIEQLSIYVGTQEPGGVIVLEVDRRNYAFGEISRLVETNNAYITQLNTYTEADSGLFIVSIKVNKVEISDIIATFQRYDYTVRYYFGEEQFANELKENYNHLMMYLNL